MSKKEHVWEFGHGEVSVAVDYKEKAVKLERVSPTHKFKVGDLIEPGNVGALDESRAPVVMNFANSESLTVLITRLQILQDRMINDEVGLRNDEAPDTKKETF